MQNLQFQSSTQKKKKKKGAWRATVHGIAESQTWPSMHTHKAKWQAQELH